MWLTRRSLGGLFEILLFFRTEFRFKSEIEQFFRGRLHGLGSLEAGWRRMENFFVRATGPRLIDGVICDRNWGSEPVPVPVWRCCSRLGVRFSDTEGRQPRKSFFESCGFNFELWTGQVSLAWLARARSTGLGQLVQSQVQNWGRRKLNKN